MSNCARSLAVIVSLVDLAKVDSIFIELITMMLTILQKHLYIDGDVDSNVGVAAKRKPTYLGGSGCHAHRANVVDVTVVCPDDCLRIFALEFEKTY